MTPQLPLHVLGSGSIGLLFAASIRRRHPSYPVTALLRPRHRRHLRPPSDLGPPRDGVASDGPPAAASAVSCPSVIRASLSRPGGGGSDSGGGGGGGGSSPPPAGESTVQIPAEIIGDEDLSPSSSSPPPIRALLLCTKAPDAASAVASVASRLDPAGAEVTVLSNGAMAAMEEVRSALEGAGRRCVDRGREGRGGGEDAIGGGVGGSVGVALGLTTHGARLLPTASDGVYRVMHAGYGRALVRSARLAELLDSSGLRASRAAPSEMRASLWKKLAANCAINPLTALRGCTNGELGLRPDAAEHVYDDDRSVMDEIVREVSEVAKAEAGATSATSARATDAYDMAGQLGYNALRSFVHEVIKETAENRSSMLQDVMARRHPTEVRYLNGYVARLGERYGIATPANSDVWERVERLTDPL